MGNLIFSRIASCLYSIKYTTHTHTHAQREREILGIIVWKYF